MLTQLQRCQHLPPIELAAFHPHLSRSHQHQIPGGFGGLSGQLSWAQQARQWQPRHNTERHNEEVILRVGQASRASHPMPTPGERILPPRTLRTIINRYIRVRGSTLQNSRHDKFSQRKRKVTERPLKQIQQSLKIKYHALILIVQRFFICFNQQNTYNFFMQNTTTLHETFRKDINAAKLKVVTKLVEALFGEMSLSFALSVVWWLLTRDVLELYRCNCRLRTFSCTVKPTGECKNRHSLRAAINPWSFEYIKDDNGQSRGLSRHGYRVFLGGPE